MAKTVAPSRLARGVTQAGTPHETRYNVSWLRDDGIEREGLRTAEQTRRVGDGIQKAGTRKEPGPRVVDGKEESEWRRLLIRVPISEPLRGGDIASEIGSGTELGFPSSQEKREKT